LYAETLCYDVAGGFLSLYRFYLLEGKCHVVL
jgi:hypothetical protein